MTSATPVTPSPTYEIRVSGLLDPRWQTWFDEASIRLDIERGETVFTAVLPDQAALHGLLQKIRDLNLPLISVFRREA